MTQLSLTAWTRPVASPKATPQAREIVRVARGIAPIVLEFCKAHRVFHAEDLRAFVMSRTGRAPGSADRILRDLRRQGFLDYSVERSLSRYTMNGVRA
jgi:hypothetical protein